MEFVKRILLPVLLLVVLCGGVAATAVYQPRLAEIFIGELPRMIVPSALGATILWRQYIIDKRLNGRIDELKDGLRAEGMLQGMEKATKMAREDRKEFKEALLTPVIPPDTDPPSKGK